MGFRGCLLKLVFTTANQGRARITGGTRRGNEKSDKEVREKGALEQVQGVGRPCL